jgi:NAD(P)-dependent dehydrogenase (short-subunit alcohol dehydrogenase family)
MSKEGANPSQQDDWESTMLKNSLGLEGKAAIVTGGGAAGEGIGNGRAAAILLARAGARVLVVDRDLALAQRTVKMIEDEGGKAVAHEADLAFEGQCQAVVTAAVERFGRLDVVDNNVGISSKGSVVEESQEAWAQVMQVNVESVFLTSKYAIPAMIESGDGGAIVNISSTAALRPRGLTAYTASKGAIISLTRAMAVDHGMDDIRVSGLMLGLLISLALAPVTYEDRQVGIEGLQAMLPPKLRITADAFVRLVGASIFGLMGWQAIERSADSFRIGEYVGAMEIQLWPLKSVFAFGVLLTCLGLAALLVRSVRRPPDRHS